MYTGEEYAGDYIENDSEENDDDDEGARVMEGGNHDEDDNTVFQILHFSTHSKSSNSYFFLDFKIVQLFATFNIIC